MHGYVCVYALVPPDSNQLARLTEGGQRVKGLKASSVKSLVNTCEGADEEDALCSLPKGQNRCCGFGGEKVKNVTQGSQIRRQMEIMHLFSV